MAGVGNLDTVIGFLPATLTVKAGAAGNFIVGHWKSDVVGKRGDLGGSRIIIKKENRLPNYKQRRTAQTNGLDTRGLLFPPLLLFFLQAENGIRDIGVTGVQTCALPIYPRLRSARARVDGDGRRRQPRHGDRLPPGDADRQGGDDGQLHRGTLEERRGGEEGRFRWEPDHYKKRKQATKLQTAQNSSNKRTRHSWSTVSATSSLFSSSRKRHTRYWRDWSSDVCSSHLPAPPLGPCPRRR